MKKFRSNQNKPSTTINMSEATKRRTRCLRLSKRKMEGSCSRKRHVQNLAVTSSRHKMARYIGEIKTVAICRI